MTDTLENSDYRDSDPPEQVTEPENPDEPVEDYTEVNRATPVTGWGGSDPSNLPPHDPMTTGYAGQLDQNLKPTQGTKPVPVGNTVPPVQGRIETVSVPPDKTSADLAAPNTEQVVPVPPHPQGDVEGQTRQEAMAEAAVSPPPTAEQPGEVTGQADVPPQDVGTGEPPSYGAEAPL